MKTARQLWWLHPAWIGGGMGAMVSIASYLTPDSMYRTYWRMPKFFDSGQLALCLACVAFFVLGSVAGIGRVTPSRIAADWKLEIPWKLAERAFAICFWGSLAGYAMWLGAALARGASASLFLGVLRGEKFAAYEMKEVYLVTISGVTTLTQFGIAAMVLGVMIGVAQGWRSVRLQLAILFFLSVARALFNSERLAIIELAIPATVLFLRLGVIESRWWDRIRVPLQFAPAAGFAVLVLVFGAFEYFRSWTTFYAGGDLGFWQFASLRLLGYYVTALNNGALLVARFDVFGAPFSTLHFLWRFPVVSSVAQAVYPNLALDTPADADPYLQMLDREANPEFNNASGLLPPVVDFGPAGALLFWLLAGLLCGLLYRWFVEKRAAGLLFYPIFFIGIVEIARIQYWGEGRVVTAYFVLIPFVWLCARWAQRVRIASRKVAWHP